MQSPVTNKKYILGGTQHQVIDYCRSKGIRPNEVVIVNKEEQLYGINIDTIIFIGTYWMRRDINRITDILNSRKCKIIFDDY